MISRFILGITAVALTYTITVISLNYLLNNQEEFKLNESIKNYGYMQSH